MTFEFLLFSLTLYIGWQRKKKRTPMFNVWHEKSTFKWFVFLYFVVVGFDRFYADCSHFILLQSSFVRFLFHFTDFLLLYLISFRLFHSHMQHSKDIGCCLRKWNVFVFFLTKRSKKKTKMWKLLRTDPR